MIKSYVKAAVALAIGLALLRAEAHPVSAGAVNTILWLIIGGVCTVALGVGVAYWRLRKPRIPEVREDAEYEAPDYTHSPDPKNPIGVERHFYGAGPAAARMPGMWRAGIQLLGGLVASDLAYFAGASAPFRLAIVGRGARVPGRVSRGGREWCALGLGLGLRLGGWGRGRIVRLHDRRPRGEGLGDGRALEQKGWRGERP